MINVREYFADLALMAEGLSAAPDKLEDYLDLIATCDEDRANPKRCRELASMSSCALTLRGIWKRAGVAHPILLAPYRNQRAVSDLVEIATDAKAIRGLEYEIGKGDGTIIGEGNNVHALTVRVRVANEIDSVDGGQHLGLFEGITEKQRLEVDTAGARYLGGRRIQFVFDVEAIAARWAIAEDDEPNTERSAT